MIQKTFRHIEFHDLECKNCRFEFIVKYWDKTPDVYMACPNCGWRYVIAAIENMCMMTIIKSYAWDEFKRSKDELKGDHEYDDERRALIESFDALTLKYLNQQEKEILDHIPNEYWIYRLGSPIGWRRNKPESFIQVSDDFPKCKKKTFDKAFRNLLEGRAITREGVTRERVPFFYILESDKKGQKKREIKQIEGTQKSIAEFSNEDLLADDWILCDNWLPLLVGFQNL